MSHLAFRVQHEFGWNGWQYSPRPNHPCGCDCDKAVCSDQQCSECKCVRYKCACICTRPRHSFAGDIWIVEERHPRLEPMLRGGLAAYDSALDVNELMRDEFHQQKTTALRGLGVVRQPAFFDR